MILFVIFGTVLATQCLGLVCAILALFDHEHRLHADRLSQRKGPRVDLVTGCCQVRSSYHAQVLFCFRSDFLCHVFIPAYLSCYWFVVSNRYPPRPLIKHGATCVTPPNVATRDATSPFLEVARTAQVRCKRKFNWTPFQH